MITKVEARGFQCLRYVSQTLKPYQILVGPNGSGKSAFLDVMSFVWDVICRGAHEAVSMRTSNFYDLVWGRGDGSFSLALEAADPKLDLVVRHEIEVGIDASDGAVSITRESLVDLNAPESPLSFPMLDTSWQDVFGLFGITKVSLDSNRLRSPSPPGTRSDSFDGSTLALLAERLRNQWPDAFASWLQHIQTAVPDIDGIRVVDRLDHSHRYLMVQYGGLEVPRMDGL